MDYLKTSLSQTHDQLRRQSPVIQILAGLLAGAVCGCILGHLGKSILYALGLTLLFFELTTRRHGESGATEPWHWSSGDFSLNTRPYALEMKELFLASQSLAVSFVSGCLIGFAIGG